jgi:hypothetical protein
MIGWRRNRDVLRDRGVVPVGDGVQRRPGRSSHFPFETGKQRHHHENSEHFFGSGKKITVDGRSKKRARGEPEGSDDSLVKRLSYLVFGVGVVVRQRDEELVLYVDVVLSFVDCVDVGLVNALLDCIWF